MCETNFAISCICGPYHHVQLLTGVLGTEALQNAKSVLCPLLHCSVPVEQK